MQIKTRPTPVATKIAYVKTANCLTIVVNGQSIFVRDADNKLFDAISTGNTDRATEFLIDRSLGLSQLAIALKLSAHRDFVAHNGKLFFADPDGLIEIDPAVAHRLVDLQVAGLPHYPLLKFWAKFATSAAYANSNPLELIEFFDKVGTPLLPLTWDGDAVAYFRAHKGEIDPTLDSSDPAGSGLAFRAFNRTTLFDPSVEVEVNGRRFDCRRSDGRIDPLFSLQDIRSFCSDRGAIYEVAIDASDFVSFDMRSWGHSQFQATTVTGIRSLGLASNEVNQGIIELPVTNASGGLALRAPHSGAATAAYLVELAGASERTLDEIRSSEASLPALNVTGC